MTLDLVLQRIDIALQEGRQTDALAILEGAVADEGARIRKALKAAVLCLPPMHEIAEVLATIDRICPEP